MYKKIIAFVLSSLMLAQSVSAANLFDFINDPTKIPAQLLTDNQFDYGKFRTKIDGESEGKITTTLEALASVEGLNTYQDRVVSSSSIFDFKVTFDMSSVKNTFNTLYSDTIDYIDKLADGDKAALTAQFKASSVTGNFKVVVNADNGLTGFNQAVTLQQVGRANADAFVVTNQTWDPSTRVAVVDFEVAPGITIDKLHTDPTLLNDLYVVAPITATTSNKDLNVDAELTSAKTTFVDGTKAYAFIEYFSNKDKATVCRTTESLGKDGLKDDTPPEVPPVTEAPKAWLVTTDGNIDVTVEERDGSYFVDVDAVEVPEKEGFVFEGLYLDPVFTEPVSGEIQIDKNTYLYPKYINISAPSQFISDEHMAYIMGYPDGEVKPNNNITREEVVAALYRLLKPEFKATISTGECNFPDVEEGRWSYESIAAFAKAGYVVGDLEGRFNPANPITRAEFVTIINKFAAELPKHSGSHFTDISGHWAEESIISSAIDWSWVTGYEDNTFRPNSRITRAEAVTIINKMLVRYGDVDSELAKQWPDLKKSDWYYGAMIEATTDHDYTRNANGWSETWTN